EVLLRGKSVPYYYASEESVPPKHHSKMQFESDYGRVNLHLKLVPEAVEATGPNDWEIRVDKDFRLPALVSLLKAAHLTLFKMLGYRYVLSAGGYYIGRSILGEFFLQNAGLNKSKVTANAISFFKEFSRLVRPVISHNPQLNGTVADNQLYICQTT